MLIIKNRDCIFDIAKGIGIILVVLGHCAFSFTNFVYMFHVSLFFIISGYFFSEKYSENRKLIKEFIYIISQIFRFIRIRLNYNRRA